MNKQEAIETIEQDKIQLGRIAEINSEVNSIQRKVEMVDYVPLETVVSMIDKINEPQKPVVQKFVAEYIERCKFSGWHLQKALYRLDDDDKVGGWAYDENDDLISEKVDTFARAWLNGYDVEKEKLYTVEIPNPNNTSPKYKLMLVKGTNGVEILRDYYNEKRDPYIFRLTESEIRKDFEWAWRWAKEVER